MVRFESGKCGAKPHFQLGHQVAALQVFFQETILLKTMARVLIEEKRMRYGNDERMRYGVDDAQNGDNVP